MTPVDRRVPPREEEAPVWVVVTIELEFGTTVLVTGPIDSEEQALSVVQLFEEDDAKAAKELGLGGFGWRYDVVEMYSVEDQLSPWSAA